MTCISMNIESTIAEAMKMVREGNGEQAVGLLENSAKYGNPELFSLLGKIMEEGMGGVRNCERAVSYYKEGLERGDRKMSPVRLGRLYLTGDCVEADPAKARELFLVAEQEGECLGAFGVGLSYTLFGKTSKDYKKGREAYVRSLRCGNLLSIGLLGENYQRDGRKVAGLILRFIGSCITIPLVLIFPRSRLVKSL